MLIRRQGGVAAAFGRVGPWAAAQV